MLGWPPVAVFILAALGIVPLASSIGDATEDLAAHTDPRLGALLNATLGNAAELIITITAVQAGLLELVKASITGSIIGNLLLVLGFAMAAGGIRHGTQKFNKTNASRNAILLALAVTTLIIPSVFSQIISATGNSNGRDARASALRSSCWCSTGSACSTPRARRKVLFPISFPKSRPAHPIARPVDHDPGPVQRWVWSG